MDYKKLYQKYKLKYLNLKNQNGGASLIDALGLDSPRPPSSPSSPSSPRSKPFLDVDKYKQDLNLEKPKIDVSALRDFRKPVPAPVTAPVPAPKPSTSTSTTTKINYFHPLYVVSHGFKTGDRVMKTKFTSDPMEGSLGDRGTIISTDYLHNIVGVKFDRLVGLISYVPSWSLTRVYDPLPRIPKIKIDLDDEDDEDDYDVEIKRKSSKKSSKKTKKSSKKTKKSSKKTKKSSKKTKKSSKKSSKKTKKSSKKTNKKK